MKTCLLADDHQLVREAMELALLRRWPDLEIHHAASFGEAWGAASEQIDLCLIDLAMPGASPKEGVEAIRQKAPNAPLIVISGSYDDALMLELIATGVQGLVSKAQATETIMAAIDLVLAGGTCFPPRVAELALKGISRDANPAIELSISGRRAEVLRLLVAGLSNKEIARELTLSPNTVKVHIAHVLALLGAGNRTEAAVKAKDLDLG